MCRIYMTVLFLSEEILDDGVGLFLESSGDSLDDDSEIFSEFDECTKVRAQCLSSLLLLLFLLSSQKTSDNQAFV